MIGNSVDLAGLDGGRVHLASHQLGQLSSGVYGKLLRAGDEGWNDAVLLWNGAVPRTPALVLQPASSREVAAAVAFARDNDLVLSVKGGGHNIAGTALAEGGLVLDMSRMRAVEVDTSGMLAHVDAGCLLKHVDRATQQHGLATVLGMVSETGSRRPDPGRRFRLSDPAIRLDCRQPRGRRSRHRGRPGPHGQPQGAPRSVLGTTRRWRELRSRDALHLPLAPRRTDRDRGLHDLER